ncbi:hypothetical protein LAZ67_9001527, partial [Cordylochernes scorpioides]
MSEEHEQNDDWIIECSDDEYASNSKNWEPSPEEIISLYTELHEKGILELEWKCPGRRSPSVHSAETESVDKKAQEDEDAANKRTEATEFDFDEEISEPTASSNLTTRRRTGLG